MPDTNPIPENQNPDEDGPKPETRLARPSVAPADALTLARRIDEAQDLSLKGQLLWSLPTLQRHAALGVLGAETIAALVESNPEENTALLGNLPAEKFTQVINLGAPDQGRRWLERAVSSKMLAAQMLPALLPSRDLMRMLMTSSEYRNALSGLLNFRRAEEMRTLLHPLEWKESLDDLLLADAEELLRKAPIRDRNIRAILQSLVDFFPELYLSVIRESLEYAKYQEDRGEELADILEGPLSIPEMLNQLPGQGQVDSAGDTPDRIASSKESDSSSKSKSVSPSDLMPTSGDPFLQMATSELPVNRRDQLEAELKDLLRQEILATGSFAQADLLRAAGRLIFQIRAGLVQLEGTTPQSASAVLLNKSFADIVLLGARVTERFRQRALQLSGTRDWLDRFQRQFLTAMNTLEAGIESATGQPALYLATRANQLREDYQPMLLWEVEQRLSDIGTWSSLARAAFGKPARVQAVLATLRTHTFEEAMRRTVIALCLYRRWEPELVQPAEDFVAFKKDFSDQFGRFDTARQVVSDALDSTPSDVWRPLDSRDKARMLFMRIIDQIEKPPVKQSKRKVDSDDDDAA